MNVRLDTKILMVAGEKEELSCLMAGLPLPETELIQRVIGSSEHKNIRKIYNS